MSEKLIKFSPYILVIGIFLAMFVYTARAEEIQMNRRAFNIFKGTDIEKDNLSLLYGKIDYLSEQLVQIHSACVK